MLKALQRRGDSMLRRRFFPAVLDDGTRTLKNDRGAAYRPGEVDLRLTDKDLRVGF